LSQPFSDHKPQAAPTRRLILLLGGFFLLGLALALLLFGQSLLDNFAGPEEIDLPQIPAAEDKADLTSLYGDPLLVGDKAYNFTLPDLDGREVSLNQFLGRPLIINFWATWCAPCRLEMPHIQEAFEAHEKEGLVVLAVNQQEQDEQVSAFFDELGFTFTPLLDLDGEVSGAYGAYGLPSTYFIDESGVVTAVHRGILFPEQIDDYLAQTLP
jgi:cytochrome c biogenesis protein CcmG, thiol:disulfide interchange protein DsbE